MFFQGRKFMEDKENPETMEKTITSFGFDSRNPIDRQVVIEANRYCSTQKGIPALSALRNLLLRILPQETKRIEKQHGIKVS